MGYLKIPNLYADTSILMMKEVYALEKIHGTSANVSLDKDRNPRFHSGGAEHQTFISIFASDLHARLAQLVPTGPVTIYGEAYGGKIQKFSHTYGKDLRFIAFDVQIGDCWLSVPDAAKLVADLGLEFVPYEVSTTIIEALDAIRDRPSEVAKRCGIVEDKLREGIVLRPLIEVTKNNGNRLIAKHKGDAFSERMHQPKVQEGKGMLLVEAQKIADEFVTAMRLDHILGKGVECSTSNISSLIQLMVTDIEAETETEVVLPLTREAKSAIGKNTAKLVKQRLQDQIHVPVLECSSTPPVGHLA